MRLSTSDIRHQLENIKLDPYKRHSLIWSFLNYVLSNYNIVRK